MGWTDIAAAGVSAAAGAYGAAQQRKFDREEAATQRQWNEDMADKQNAWNYQMWKEQNEYNSPANQIARLQEAGLNPLYYGLDGSSAAQLTAAQPLGYDRASAANFANPVQAGIDAALKTAQISNIRANTAKTSEETLTEVIRREKLSQDIDNARQALENMKAEQGLTYSQQREIEKRLNWIDRINEATVSYKESEIALNKSAKKRIDELLAGEKAIQNATLDDFEKRWEKIDAEIKKISAETGIAYKDLEYYSINHSANGVFGTGISLPNFIRMLKDPNYFKRSKQKNPDSEQATADATASIIDNKY